MGIEIKTKKSSLQDIRFTDWINETDLSEPKVITLLAFFIPGKYSSFTLSFTDGTYRIRKSFSKNNQEVINELKKWYKEIASGTGKALFEVRKNDDKYILDFIGMDNNKDYQYKKDINGSLILKKISEQKEDIPF